MTKLCQCCSKRYMCKEVDTKEECNRFKSWINVKNYGEVKRIEKCTNDPRREIHIREDIS